MYYFGVDWYDARHIELLRMQLRKVQETANGDSVCWLPQCTSTIVSLLSLFIGISVNYCWVVSFKAIVNEIQPNALFLLFNNDYHHH